MFASHWRRHIAAVSAAAFGTSYALRESKHAEMASAVAKPLPAIPASPGAPPPPPYFRRSEIATHTTKEDRVWVTYKEGVYDITDFVLSHPGGGDKIMLAAGKAIDPFWRIYQAHLNSPLAMSLLGGFRIGSLDPTEPPTVVDSEDPYAADPDRHPGLIYHNNKPCNAELPAELMMQVQTQTDTRHR